MEVFPCSGLHYVEESDCPQQGSGTTIIFGGESNCLEHGEEVQVADVKVSDLVHVQNFSCDAHDSEDGNLNGQAFCTESCLASETDHLLVDTIESGVLSNKEGESSLSESKWLEHDESLAVWVKWRGKWQTAIKCARADWPLSTVKAKPTHDRKKYLVIFFPRKRNYSWADVLLVRPINEFPEPIAYRTHKVGMKMVKDLTLAHRFIMQKLAVSMLNIIDQLHTKALTETARSVMVWKEFAMEASRCKGYFDLGRILLKLQNVLKDHT